MNYNDERSWRIMELEKQAIHLNAAYNFGNKKWILKMSIFDLYKQMMIHHTGYTDPLSDYPKEFFTFVYQTFNFEDVTKCLKVALWEILE